MQCQFIKPKKERCNAKILKGEKYCFYHSDKTKRARLEASSKGGTLSRKNNLDLSPKTIEKPSDILEIVAETLNLLRGGRIHPNYSNAIFIGCNTFLKVFEKAEYE